MSDPWSVDSSRMTAERKGRSRDLVRRSVLIVPTNTPRFVERAHTRGADAIMLDLEDSIPSSEKTAARNACASAISRVGQSGASVLVRVNKPFDLLIHDLDVAVAPGIDAIATPKIESGREIAIIDALIAEREARRGLTPGSIAIAVSIESALGVANLDAILGASGRIVTADIGIEDYCTDLGIEPTRDGREIVATLQELIRAARRARVQPMGMAATLANYGDIPALREAIATAAAMGFRGASCIHPGQVAHLNELFSPSSDAVARARAILAVYAEAEAVGRGSATLDGKMIDAPVVERARTLIARADRIAHAVALA